MRIYIWKLIFFSKFINLLFINYFYVNKKTFYMFESYWKRKYLAIYRYKSIIYIL